MNFISLDEFVVVKKSLSLRELEREWELIRLENFAEVFVGDEGGEDDDEEE